MYQLAGNIRVHAFTRIGSILSNQGGGVSFWRYMVVGFCHNLSKDILIMALVIAGIQVDGRSNMGIPPGDEIPPE